LPVAVFTTTTAARGCYGQVLRASGDEHPDLFWAIRGGGGNFGVASRFEFELHKVGPMVQFGLFFWSPDQGPQALRVVRAITGAMPPEINAVVAAVNARRRPSSRTSTT
jgi:FAD/FMN-containing dehydrogenase